jgi:osmotically-inducible protein OsmY
VTSDTDRLARIHAAIGSEPRIRPTGRPIHLAFLGRELLIEGEVDHIAGKKLALRVAARASGADIVDRLHMRPAAPMGDGESRTHLCDALLGEPVLADFAIAAWDGDLLDTLRDPDGATGRIEIRVQNGAVTLDGEVAGLGRKRFAGVLAWWVPGSRDVVNGLGVSPPETDDDGAITDTVRQVLEKDPLVASAAIEIGTRAGEVTLLGSVPSEQERRMAEADAWYVFGVDAVLNRLDVQP